MEVLLRDETHRPREGHVLAGRGAAERVASLETGCCDDRSVEVRTRHAAVTRSVAVLNHRSVGRGDPIATSVRRCEDRRCWVRAPKGAGGVAVVTSVPVAIDRPIGGEDPTAATVRSPHGRRHRGPGVARGAVIGGIAETVDIPGLGYEPVTVATG